MPSLRPSVPSASALVPVSEIGTKKNEAAVCVSENFSQKPQDNVAAANTASFDDECRFWAERSAEVASGSRSSKMDASDAAVAEAASTLLLPLRRDMLTFLSLPFAGASRTLDDADAALAELTALPGFPKTSVFKIDEAVSSTALAYCDQLLPRPSFAFEVADAAEEGKYASAQSILTLLERCQTCTSPFLHERVSRVRAVSSLIDFLQLAAVTSSSENNTNMPKVPFHLQQQPGLSPRGPLNAIYTNLRDIFENCSWNAPNSTWEECLKKADVSMRSLESIVARTLRIAISADDTFFDTNLPLLVIALQRPQIAKVLASERKAAELTLLAELGQIEKAASNILEWAKDPCSSSSSIKNAKKNSGTANLSSNTRLSMRPSEIVISARYNLNLLRQQESISSFIVSDQNEYNRRRVAAARSLTEAEHYAVSSWQDAVLSNMPSFTLPDQLLGISTNDGLLYVKYPDMLVTFLSETRRLLGLSCRLKPRVVTLADDAAVAYKPALQLRQIANLHNSIEAQIAPYHMPLLLNLAVALESAVRSQPPSWRDTYSSSAFVSSLLHVSSELESANQKLKSAHYSVIKLFVSNFHSRSGQNSTVSEIQEILSALPWPESAQLPWRTHLQVQIHKVVAVNYARGLVNISMPDLHVDVHGKLGILVLRPSLEDLRVKYFRELRRILLLPFSTPPLVNGVDAPRKEILLAYEKELGILYERSNAVFNDFQQALRPFCDWLFLGKISSERLAERLAPHCLTLQDYETHFRCIKIKGKEAETTIPNSIRVENIVCSLLPLKSTVEDYLQRLFDALVAHLNASLQGHIKRVTEHIESGLRLFSQSLTTIGELANATILLQELQDNAPGIEIDITQIEQKQKLLARGAQGTVRDMATELSSRHSQFEMLFNGFKMLLADQTKLLRPQLDKRILSFNNAVSQFQQTVSQLKTRSFASLENLLTVSHFDLQKTSGIDDLKAMSAELDAEYTQIECECKFFGVTDYPTFGSFEDLKAEVAEIFRTQTLFSEFQSACAPLLCTPLRAVLVSTLDSVVDCWRAKLLVLQRRDGIKNLQVLQRAVDAISFLRTEWSVLFPDIAKFGPRHWAEVCAILKIKNASDAVTVLDAILAKDNLESNRNQLLELNIDARKEAVLREALQEIEMWASSTQIPTCSSAIILKESSTVQIVGDCTQLLCELGEHRAVIASLQSSPEASRTSTEMLGYWAIRFSEFEKYLQILLLIQRKWRNIRVIADALPATLQNSFNQADLFFRTLMQKLAKDARPLQFLGFAETSQLPKISAVLEECQRAVSDFLEAKRDAFPRFYFVGDEDLLEIITAGSASPSKVIVHLKKLFNNVINIEICDSHITSVCGADSETLHLQKPVSLNQDVTDWLSALSDEIGNTLASALSQIMMAPPHSLEEKLYPAQIRELAFRIRMTAQIERAIEQKKLPGLLSTFAGPKSYDTIYYTRIVDDLVKAKVSSKHDFLWQRVLRFYYNAETDKCIARVFDFEIEYSFEYARNMTQLVQSPLTDFCYASLGHAMSEGLGGCLFGPAGTGKTESVKHMGQLLGRHVLVFNCDEGLDTRSIQRLLCGIIKCGAWGCFDEFNRLTLDVLSAVSNVVSQIQHGLLHRSPTVFIAGKTMSLCPRSSIFVTLNPAGKKYKGRRTLPGNLKQLFRSVAVCEPDSSYICSTELNLCGYKDPEKRGSHIASLFDTCNRVLSPQRHYDWGLRSIKTVVTEATRTTNLQAKSTREHEEAVLRRAVETCVLGKLVDADRPQFARILDAYFPNLQSLSASDAALNARPRQEAESAVKSLNLEQFDWQIEAAVHLAAACRQRIGACIVGPPQAGKFTLVRIVAQMLKNASGAPAKAIIVSPKSITRTQLLGHLNPHLREWHDGVVSFNARRFANAAPDSPHYILVFDGDIDSTWIEAMNSVLDDNRLLTLPSGERIKLGNVNFVFICGSLEHASPATVSRLGVIHLDGLKLNNLAHISKQDQGPVSEASTLFVGVPGSGRRQKLLQEHQKHSSEIHLSKNVLVINCTAQTTSKEVVNSILELCEICSNSTGFTLVPKENAGQLILVLCDMDQPEADEFGTVQLHQFAHCLLKYRGFQNPRTHEWLQASCIKFFATAGPLWETKLSSRLLALFKIQHCELPEYDILRAQVLQLLTKNGCEERLAGRVSELYANFIQSNKSYKNLSVTCSPRVFTEIASHALNESKKCSIPKERALYLIFQIFLNRDKKIDLDDFASELGASTKDVGNSSIGEHFFVLDRLRKQQNISEKAAYIKILESDDAIEFAECVQLALELPFKTVLVRAAPGLPDTAILRAVAKSLGYEIVKPTYLQKPNLPQFLHQLRESISNVVLSGSHVIFEVDSFSCPEPQYYHLLHRTLSSKTLTNELLPDEKALDSAKTGAGFSGSTIDYLATMLRSNFKLVMRNMNENWINGFTGFLKLGVRLTWENISSKLFLECANSLDESIAKKIYDDYTLRQSATPRHLLHTLSAALYTKKHKFEELEKRHEFLEKGLQALQSARKEIEKLALTASEQEKELAERQEEAKKTLGQIQETIFSTSAQKVELEGLSASLEKEEAELSRKQASLQLEISSVEPLLVRAKEAVRGIRSEHLAEVRSLRAPPNTVRDVLEGVLLLLGQQDMSWAAMKSFLGKKSFKDEIINFDVKSVTPTIRGPVENLIEQKPESFVEANAKKGSIAAAPLASWVKANLEYSKVLESVLPLQTALSENTTKIEASRKRLLELSEAVSSVDKRVADLQCEFAAKTGEAQTLVVKLESTRAALDRAKLLLDSLGDEQERWSSDLHAIALKLDSIESTCASHAVYCTWAGTLDEDARTKLRSVLDANIGPPSFELSELLEVGKRDLLENEDRLSLENQLISSIKGSEITFVVNETVNVGRKKMLAWFEKTLGSNFKVVSASNSSWIKEVEIAMRLGGTVFLENVDFLNISPWLVSIITQDFEIIQDRAYLVYGNKTSEITSGFKLVLCAADVPLLLQGHVVLLSWATTANQIEARALESLRAADSPGATEKISQLVDNERKLAIKLSKLQNNILEELSATSGDILKNDKLLESLSETKVAAEAAASGITEAKSMREQLRKTDEDYRPLVEAVARIYLVLKKAESLHEHYCFPLWLFLTWFDGAVARNPISAFQQASFSKRSDAIKLCLLRQIATEVRRRTQEQHHDVICFALLAEHSESGANTEQLKAISGLLATTNSIESVNISCPSWIPLACEDAYKKLAKYIENTSSLERQKDALLEWHKGKITRPDCFKSVREFSAGEKIILSGIFRPDKQLSEIRASIESCFGNATPSLSSSLATACAPVLVFVPSGFDVAEYMGASAVESSISLGDGMLGLASSALEKALLTTPSNASSHAVTDKQDLAKGALVIQNLHASSSWVATCAGILQSFTNYSGTQPIIFTCELDTATIPKGFLERCEVIFVHESPRFCDILDASLALLPRSPTDNVQITQKRFLAAWAHSLLVSRRRFVPQGWMSAYEFSPRDLNSVIRILNNDFNTIRGIASMVYAGYIGNSSDATRLSEIMATVFCEEFVGSNGRMPTAKLHKSISLPNGENFAEFVKRAVESLHNVPESELLYLAPNIERAQESIVLSETLTNARHLLCAEADLAKSRGKKAKSVNFTNRMLEQWKSEISRIKIPKQNKYNSPCAETLVSGVQELQFVANQVCQDIAEAVKLPESESSRKLESELAAARVPEEWTDRLGFVTRDSSNFVTDFVKALQKQLEMAQAFESAYPNLPATISLAIPSASSLLSVLRLQAASSLTRESTNASVGTLAHELILQGRFDFDAKGSKSNSSVGFLAQDLLLQGARIVSGTLQPIVSSEEPALTRCSVYFEYQTSSSRDAKAVVLPIFNDVTRNDLIVSAVVAVASANYANALSLASAALFLFP